MVRSVWTISVSVVYDVFKRKAKRISATLRTRENGPVNIFVMLTSNWFQGESKASGGTFSSWSCVWIARTHVFVYYIHEHHYSRKSACIVESYQYNGDKMYACGSSDACLPAPYIRDLFIFLRCTLNRIYVLNMLNVSLLLRFWCCRLCRRCRRPNMDAAHWLNILGNIVHKCKRLSSLELTGCLLMLMYLLLLPLQYSDIRYKRWSYVYMCICVSVCIHIIYILNNTHT